MELSNSYTWEPPGENREPVTFHYDELGTLDGLEYEALFNDLNPGGRLTAEQIAAMQALCVKHVHGWEGVTDKGVDAPCTEANRRRVFAMASVFPCVVELAAAVCPVLTVTEPEKKASTPGSASASSDPGSSAAGGTTSEQVSDGVAV